MTTLANNFEGGTSGAAITAANSGGTSGSAFDSVTLVSGGTLAFDAAVAAHGSLSAKVATGATAGGSRMNWAASLGAISGSTVWFRLYLFFTANPAAEVRVFAAAPASGTCAALSVSAAGKLIFRNATGSIVTTSTAAIPLNAWFRVEGFVTCSATAGQTEVKMFTVPDSTTVAETDTSSAAQNTNTTATQVFLGISGTAIANAGPYWIDDIGVSDQGYLGPSGVIQSAAVPARSTLQVLAASSSAPATAAQAQPAAAVARQTTSAPAVTGS